MSEVYKEDLTPCVCGHWRCNHVSFAGNCLCSCGCQKYVLDPTAKIAEIEKRLEEHRVACGVLVTPLRMAAAEAEIEFLKNRLRMLEAAVFAPVEPMPVSWGNVSCGVDALGNRLSSVSTEEIK
jgi:hypothetical protein